MQIINATPPADFPKLVIVFDRELDRRMPGRGFYVRVGTPEGNVDIVDLEGERTLPGAVSAAIAKGYSPTHWMETTEGHASMLPRSVFPYSSS